MNRKKILFMGRKPVAANCLRYLSQREDVDIVGVLTDSHLSISPTTQVAQEHGIEIYDFDSALKKIDAGLLSFDLGISMLYWRKLRGSFISTPTCGIINFHPAPLPEYKGTAGYNLAVLDGCEQWATTAHYVDEFIDTGEILEVCHFPIDPKKETAQSVERLSQKVLEDQFKRIVDKAISSKGLLPTTPNVGGRYVSRSEMEAMKEIKPGDDVARKIRAFWFPPYDGAYITIDGNKYTLTDRFILNQLIDGTSSSLFTPNSDDKNL